MKFIKIENRIINLAEITRVEILESGAVEIFFPAANGSVWSRPRVRRW
jgi:hypothetical protein